MKTMTRLPALSIEEKTSWTDALEHLTNQVGAWVANEPGWQAERDLTEITEEAIGQYLAPAMTIDTPDGRLILEPIARNYPGHGIVELYAWPTLFRVRLLYRGPGMEWQVRVDSGFVLHDEWNRDNFIRLAKDLLSAS